jgi:hypothetical protein
MRGNDKDPHVLYWRQSPETIAAPDVTSEGRNGSEKQALTDRLREKLL